MKLLILAVFAVIGYAGANCGCLKCSKHLTVLGEIPGAPGQVPIKVICRCEQGYPNLCEAIYPVQPISVQAPVPAPEPVTLCGANFPVQFKPFFKPLCSEGCYYGSGAIRGAGAAGNPCASQRNVYDYSGYYGPILPVQVQATAPQAEDNNQCFTLQGLRTAVDRIIIPAPGISPTGVTPYDRFVSQGNHHNHGCGSDCNYHGHDHDHGHSAHGCSSCHRYGYKHNHYYKNQPHKRSKRQLLQHGYKFIVNMLPPFIQDPIKNTVNKMAITHPDKKLRKVYNLPPPPLTFKEKLEQKHKENVAALKNKLFGNKNKQLKNDYKLKDVHKPYEYSKKYDRFVEEEAENFVSTLQTPESKKVKKKLRSRVKSPQSDKKYSWINEMKSSEILGKFFSKKYKKDRMTEKEKEQFLQKLHKLNHDSRRSKRDINTKTESKRSIIIGSDELDLPLYRIKIKDSDEENEIEDDYDYDYYEDDDDNDEDDSDEKVGMASFDASKEQLIRNAIREELKNFKRIQSEENLVGDPVSLFKNDKIASKFPLLRVLTFPIKFLKKIKNTEAFPIVGTVPKIIVGTKNYFKDFGKNFKKNFLHFTSDIIGDFDHDGNFLANIIKTNRLRRSIEAENNNQNFRNVSNVKVRKKRYIIKMVDEDEIEELLREKLGKMFDKPQKSHKKRVKPKKYHGIEQNKKRIKKYSDDSFEIFRKRKKPRNREDNDSFDEILRKRKKPIHRVKNKEEKNSFEDMKKKIIIEPIKPKLIIDNNGLPFMEVNGYKRPLFMKNLFKKEDKSEENINSSFDQYDSSEEMNLQKIHQVIDNAKNRKDISSRYSEMPLDAIKDKISLLLYDIDTLVHMDFEKYDEVYDDLIELQSVKKSIVQSWKRIVMDKQINNLDAKINLLEKFEQLQQLKSKSMQNIVYILQEDCKNSFALKKIIDALMMLHKIQCVIDQVVGCFHEKFKTGSKFELKKEIKFVDFLSTLKFVHAKTRNDLINNLKKDRDKELQESIMLLEKLKKIMVKGDEDLIEEEANILWEMKHVQKMQLSTIEEMCDRMEEGLQIRKNMKVLFDLSKRLKELEEKQKKTCLEESAESNSEEEENSEEEKKKIKKIDVEEVKRKWHNKIQKQKDLFEEHFKKNMLKLKELKKKNKSDENEIESDEDEHKDNNEDEDEYD